MSALFNFEQQAYWQECCNCGITFGMLSSWDKRLRDNHRPFYCPNGHSQSYTGETEVSKLRAQLELNNKELERAKRDAEWERSVAKNARTQKTKAENKLKRFTTRVNAGVCPHCNRTFKQLAAHMKSKHPGVAPATEPICNNDEHGGDHA